VKSNHDIYGECRATEKRWRRHCRTQPWTYDRELCNEFLSRCDDYEQAFGHTWWERPKAPCAF